MVSKVIIADFLDFVIRKLCIALSIAIMEVLNGNVWIKAILLLTLIHIIQESLNLNIFVYQATEKVFWYFYQPKYHASTRTKRYNHGRRHRSTIPGPSSHYDTPRPTAPLVHPAGDSRVYNTVVTHTQGEYRYYCNCEDCSMGLIERCANVKCNLCSATFKF